MTWTQATAAETVVARVHVRHGQRDDVARRSRAATGAHRDVVLGRAGVDRPSRSASSARQASVDYKTRDYMGTTGALPRRPAGAAGARLTTPRCASPDRWLFGSVEDSEGGCTNGNCYYGSTFWLYIMDRQGRIVWYYADAASNAASSSFQRIARDGEYIWIEKRLGTGSAAGVHQDDARPGVHGEIRYADSPTPST